MNDELLRFLSARTPEGDVHYIKVDAERYRRAARSCGFVQMVDADFTNEFRGHGRVARRSTVTPTYIASTRVFNAPLAKALEAAVRS